MKRILVVDDSLDILDAFKILLEAKGYEVFTLASGEKVIETASLISPDLILLDIFLGGHSGLDVCGELKSLTHLKLIPVVIMSAHSNLDKTLQECAADAFIAKPFDLTHLLAVIESQLTKVAYNK